MRVSVASTAKPPAFVIIARFSPLGKMAVSRIEAQPNKSSISSTLTTPALSKTAS